MKKKEPTPIFAYEEDENTPQRVKSEPLYWRTTSYNKRHQNLMRNVHNQVKDKLHLIANCLHENLAINAQPMIDHDYFTKMANVIIDEYTGVSMEYIQLIKNPKHRPDWIKSFANEIGRLYQGVGGRVEGTDTIFFCTTTIYMKTEGNMLHMGGLLWIIAPQRMARIVPASQLETTSSIIQEGSSHDHQI